MRISENIVNLLKKGLEEHKECPAHYQLYLFGSRSEVSKRGGDIDLLLVVDPKNADVLSSLRHQLIVALKKYIDDQKLDLTIRSQEKLESDLFYQSIKSSLILISER